MNTSLLQKLHDLPKEEIKNLDIVLYIHRGVMNDLLINEYFKDNQIDENFTIIRTRDQLNYMLGCLHTNSNKIVYASEYKHSISKDLYKLMNPDPENKNKAFIHINIKEFMRLKDRSEHIKLLQKYAPEAFNQSDQQNTSPPIDSKCKFLSLFPILKTFQIAKINVYHNTSE